VKTPSCVLGLILIAATLQVSAQTNNQCRVDAFGNRVCNGVVDLSRIGLDGMQAAQERHESQERIRAMELKREREEFELERERERWRLEQERREAQLRVQEQRSVRSGQVPPQSVDDRESGDQFAHRRASHSMSVGEWLESAARPKSSSEYLDATLLAGNVLFQWEGDSHCKPEHATVNQAMAIALRYFREHPQIWHLSAPDGVGVALGNVWPCPTDN